ncbi:hemin uptake protein HemP [Hwanghaeella grinnelliae]|uniref:Hemin uptake protein HemP n=1 Tax=Hwanghaeella grinnelliae TaxID=2500179 RepID=A0A437QUT3_9PROT|nr:hemin uptake protein HemP [Hwanghaeella grinnelliae]
MGEFANKCGDVEPTPRKESERSVTVISSADLLGGRPEVMIEHNGDLYRLRHTRQGKLILTK